MKKILVTVFLAACGGNQEPAATPTPAPAPAPATAKGTVEERTFHSDALGVDKTYVVYLPAGYATSQTKYPVFYYLHGLTGEEHSWIKGGHIDQAADQLGLQAILVMPDGDDGFYFDSAKKIDYDACLKDGTGLFMPSTKNLKKTCVKQAHYETYIVKDLIGDVDGHYRTNGARGIAGLSMGGLGAWSLGLRHPDLFAAAASHSGYLGLLYKGPHPYVAGKVEMIPAFSPGATGNEMIDYVIGVFGRDRAAWEADDPELLIQKMTPGKPALYLDAGTEDEFHFQDVATYIHDQLTARHIDHVFFIGPGHHNFDFWAPREVESLKFLQEHVAKP
ncbi:MAG: alpha/beta hydrolase family protein [Kofleriaceae bacterium]